MAATVVLLVSGLRALVFSVSNRVYLSSGVFLFWHMSVLFIKDEETVSDDGLNERHSALGVGGPGLCGD